MLAAYFSDLLIRLLRFLQYSQDLFFTESRSAHHIYLASASTQHMLDTKPFRLLLSCRNYEMSLISTMPTEALD